MTDRHYSDPAVLRQAVTDRLRQLARDRPGAQLSDLQRQFAYDRLLARVFSAEPEAWALTTLKQFLDPVLGGTATGRWWPRRQDWT